MCSEVLVPWLGRIWEWQLEVTPTHAVEARDTQAAIAKPFPSPHMGSTHSDPQRTSSWRKTLSPCFLSHPKLTGRQWDLLSGQSSSASEALSLCQALCKLEDLGMVAQVANPDLFSKQLDCSKYTCGVNNKLRKAVWSWSGGLADRSTGYPSRGHRFR